MLSTPRLRKAHSVEVHGPILNEPVAMVHHEIKEGGDFDSFYNKASFADV